MAPFLRRFFSLQEAKSSGGSWLCVFLSPTVELALSSVPLAAYPNPLHASFSVQTIFFKEGCHGEKPFLTLRQTQKNVDEE